MVYYVKFMICEFLNLWTLLANFLITDKFLNGNFATYGHDVFNYLTLSDGDQTKRQDPRCNAFPTTVCI